MEVQAKQIQGTALTDAPNETGASGRLPAIRCRTFIKPPGSAWLYGNLTSWPNIVTITLIFITSLIETPE